MRIEVQIDLPAEYIDAFNKVNDIRPESKAHAFTAALSAVRQRMEAEGRSYITSYIEIGKVR